MTLPLTNDRNWLGPLLTHSFYITLTLSRLILWSVIAGPRHSMDSALRISSKLQALVSSEHCSLTLAAESFPLEGHYITAPFEHFCCSQAPNDSNWGQGCQASI